MVVNFGVICFCFVNFHKDFKIMDAHALLHAAEPDTVATTKNWMVVFTEFMKFDDLHSH